MERLIPGIKTEVIWSSKSNNIDVSDGLDGSSLIPVRCLSQNIYRKYKNLLIIKVEFGGTLMQSIKPPVSVMDLGKMLLHCAKDGDTTKVHELMSRGAPFSTDWVKYDLKKR